jgi:hypothetical protein
MEERSVDKEESPFVQFNTQSGDWVRIPEGEEYTEEEEREKSDLDLAHGVVIPRGSKTSVKYLQNARDYNQRDAGIHKQIQLSNQLYTWEGIVGSTIDLFVDFAITEFSLENIPKRSRERAVLEHVLKTVNNESNNMETGMKYLLREIAEDYFIAGNVFPFKGFEVVSGTDISDDRVKGTRGWNLPMSIYLLNPDQIEIPESRVLIGNKEVWLQIDEELVRLVEQDPNSEEAQNILSGLTPEMQAQLKRDGKVKLPEELYSHIKRKSKGYLPWGRPYLTRAFGAIARKKKLEALDDSTIEGLINSVTIFKVGLEKDEEWITWSAERQNNFISHLSNPNPSNWLVWGPDVSVETVGPDGNILSFDNRYQQADRDILKALGIPTVLISGEGASADRSENVWVSISGLLEKLQTMRDQLQNWLEELLFDVLVDNKMSTKNKPKIRWSRINLRDEKALREFVIAYYDRGILPIETTVKEAGYDWDTVKDLRAGEKVEKIAGKSYKSVFERRDLPFSGSMPGGKPGVNAPKAGRPAGQTKPKPAAKPKTSLNDKKPVRRVQKSQADTVIDAIKFEFERLEILFEATDATEDMRIGLESIEEDFAVGMEAMRHIPDSMSEQFFNYLILKTKESLIELVGDDSNDMGLSAE